MKAFGFIFLLSIWAAATDAEYRVKMRGPPQPPQQQRQSIPPHGPPPFLKTKGPSLQGPPVKVQISGRPPSRPPIAMPLHMPMFKSPPTPPRPIRNSKPNIGGLPLSGPPVLRKPPYPPFKFDRPGPFPSEKPFGKPDKPYLKVEKQPSFHKPEKPFSFGVPFVHEKPSSFVFAEKPLALERPAQSEKPFFSAPVTPKYEYDIKEAQMIFDAHTIKQVGEKGPIHTIPAPNLSLADKPIVVKEEPRKPLYTKPSPAFQNAIHPEAQYSSPVAEKLVGHKHQYQVTESNDQHHHMHHMQFPSQVYFAPDPSVQASHSGQPHIDVQTLAANNLPQEYYKIVQQQQDVAYTSEPQISAQDLYQLFQNGYQQPQQQPQLQHQQQPQHHQQQHLLDSYGSPLMDQPQLQQHLIQQSQGVPVQSMALINGQLFHAEPNYLKDQFGQKHNFQPQYQTFNYEESSRHGPKVLGQEPEPAESIHSAMARPNTALPQSEFMKQFYKVQPDMPDIPEISPDAFFSVLPNREAAEALASLQAAGSMNTQHKADGMNEHKKRDSMRIFVPDDEQAATSEDKQDADAKKQGIQVYEKQPKKQEQEEEASEYDEYSQEVQNAGEQEEVNGKEINQHGIFGSRIRPKKA